MPPKQNKKGSKKGASKLELTVSNSPKSKMTVTNTRAAALVEMLNQAFDIAATNENVNVTTEDVNVTTEDIAATKEDVTAANENVAATNEDVTATGEDITAANEDVDATGEDVAATNICQWLQLNIGLNNSNFQAHELLFGELIVVKEHLEQYLRVLRTNKYSNPQFIETLLKEFDLFFGLNENIEFIVGTKIYDQFQSFVAEQKTAPENSLRKELARLKKIADLEQELNSSIEAIKNEVLRAHVEKIVANEITPPQAASIAEKVDYKPTKKTWADYDSDDDSINGENDPSDKSPSDEHGFVSVKNVKTRTELKPNKGNGGVTVSCLGKHNNDPIIEENASKPDKSTCQYYGCKNPSHIQIKGNRVPYWVSGNKVIYPCEDCLWSIVYSVDPEFEGSLGELCRTVFKMSSEDMPQPSSKCKCGKHVATKLWDTPFDRNKCFSCAMKLLLPVAQKLNCVDPKNPNYIVPGKIAEVIEQFCSGNVSSNKK